MALFRRKKTTTTKVPAEVKQYYESEHRERVGLAWLIAFLSLILTIVVVIGLFYGGRWIYRQITNDDSTSQPAEQGSSDEPIDAPAPNETKSQPNDLQPAAPSQNSGNTGTSSTNTQANNGSSSSSSGSSSSSSNSSTSQPKSTSSDQIADTGAGSTIAIFLGATTVATVAHLAYQRRKLSNKLSS